jgi:hypothetical protein
MDFQLSDRGGSDEREEVSVPENRLGIDRAKHTSKPQTLMIFFRVLMLRPWGPCVVGVRPLLSDR